MPDFRPHVVIVGGGFGGLYAAKALRHAAVRVSLIDKRNHHLFQPLLYQVATAGLAGVDIAVPIRKILRRQDNVTVLMATVETIDPGQRQVQVATVSGAAQLIPYDFLIVAAGVVDSYFGNDHWRPFAPGLKSLEDAVEIRRRVLLAYERAESETDPERRRRWLTFAVIGSGPTGAEMAGALAEIARHTLARDFRNFDPQDARVILIEAAGRVLPPYTEDLSAKAARQLERLGVEIRAGTPVSGVDAEGVSIGTGTGAERIPAATVVWAAGVTASPLATGLGAPTDRAGRVRVGADLTLPAHPEISVIGDLAAFEQDGRQLPGVAPVAIQQGRHAAANIRRRLSGSRSLPFHYRDRGSMATLGRRAAVADLGWTRLSGLPAWLAWLVIHIFFLIGFRNRFVVLFEWAWSYFTYQRNARLILESTSDLDNRPDPGNTMRTEDLKL